MVRGKSEKSIRDILLLLFTRKNIYVIHKEINKMSYEESVKKLLEVAGDYNATITSFNLEKAMYQNTAESSKEKMKKLIESVSIDVIHVTVSPSGYLMLETDGYKGSTCLYRNTLYGHNCDSSVIDRVLKQDLEDLLLRTISNISRLSEFRLSNVAKFIRYSSLMLASVDDQLVNTVKEAYNDYVKAENSLSSKISQYSTYSALVARELCSVARDWYKEKATFTPGMKIGVIDLRTGKTTIRTIKRCKIADGCFSIALNESASIITDPARVNKELTWYLNTKDYSDIAKKINWGLIANFI